MYQVISVRVLSGYCHIDICVRRSVEEKPLIVTPSQPFDETSALSHLQLRVDGALIPALYGPVFSHDSCGQTFHI